MGPKGFVKLSGGFCVTSSFRGLVLSSGLTTCRHMEHIAAFLILFVLAPSSLFLFCNNDDDGGNQRGHGGAAHANPVADAHPFWAGQNIF